MGLAPESFQVFDGKETPAIELFENADTQMSIGLVVDTSGSIQLFHSNDFATAGGIGDALLRFLELSNPRNEYFVMAFDNTPRFLTDWKTAAELTAQKVDIGPKKHDTALYDALFTAKEKLETGHYRKRALLVITDGEDNLSRHTFMQIRDSLRASEISVYGLGIATPAEVGSALGMSGEAILTELAEVTGGEAIFPRDPKHMNEVVEMFATELRHQYRLGFRPNPANRPNQWHRIKLTVTPRAGAPEEFRKLTVRTRPGYYSK